MSREDRVKLIEEIEKERNSKVITYVTGDRDNIIYKAQIGEDVLTKFYEVLKNFEGDKIDLFIYSRGGATQVPWKIVSLFREFCNEFSIIIPFRAHSAATMIAIGCDEIVCSSATELGPIDPTLTTQFNPRDPKNNPIGISVESVNAYRKFAYELDKSQKAFELLSQAASPLAIGEIYRQHYYIRMVAEKLLKSQKKPPSNEEINEIIKVLVEETYFHGHAISRREAKDIGLNIVKASEKLEEVMWSLFNEYSNEMQLETPFNPRSILYERNYQPTIDEGNIAFIESCDMGFYCRKKIRLEPVRQTPPSLSLNLNFQLPAGLQQMVQQDPNLQQTIQQIFNGLTPQLQQQVIQEVNRLLPVVDVNINNLEVAWERI